MARTSTAMDGPEMTAIEKGLLGDLWADFQYALQQQLKVDDGSLRHFHVHLDGRSVFQQDSVLVSGYLLRSWSPVETQDVVQSSDKVLVRLSLTDWFAVGKHTSNLRILNCPLVGDNAPPVLDTTLGTAVVATGVALRKDECIQVAELFSGGFLGWSQGVSVLRHHDVPVRLRWAIDSNPICGRSFAAQHDVANIVSISDAIEPMSHSQSPVFLNASIQDDWWLIWPARQPVDVWCCSPPCQPWSTAGSQQGLHDQDGKLLLRLLSLVQVFQPQAVCIEEVVGFRKHAHFPFLKQCWEEIGYEATWHQNVDLVDFAPQTRNRCLIILSRRDKAGDFPKLQGRPVMPKRPTLGSFDCLLQLCPELQQACYLEPSVLAKYLDPYYCPPSKFARSSSDLVAHRIVTAQGRVSTIMAQYHRQHELPESSLARGGILGNLFRDHQGLRFLSGAEVALIHCCNEPLFLPQNDAQLMSIVGNSLSVPQAILPLALAVSSFQPQGTRVDPLQAVHWAVGERIRASQVAIVPLKDGWVLCKPEQVQVAMSRLRPVVPWGQMPNQDLPRLHLFWVRDDFDTVAFLKFPGFSLPHLLDSLKIQYDEHSLQDVQTVEITSPLKPSLIDQPLESAVVETPCIPELRTEGLLADCDPRTGPSLMTVIGAQAVYVLAAEGPTVAESLHHIAAIDGVNCLDGKALWQTVDAKPIQRWEEFEGTLVLVHDSDELPISLPDCSRECLLGVRFLSYVDPARLFLPEDVALQVGAGFQMQLLTSIGWFPRLVPLLADSVQGISIVFQPQPGRLRLRQEDIAHFCAATFFQGCLKSL